MQSKVNKESLRKLNKFNNPVATTVKLYLLSTGFFFVFRLILFLTQLDRIALEQDSISNIFSAFIMGLRFDIVVTGYILILPVLILLILDLLKSRNRIALNFIFYFVLILYAFSFLITSADIPYFNQFFARFNIMAFEWIESPKFVFNMIIEEPSYFVYIFLFIGIIILFYWLLRKVIFAYQPSNLNIWWKVPVMIMLIFLMFIGIRGRLAEKSPIRIGTAYFCDNAFFNQLGLNPVFTLLRSYLDHLKTDNKPISLIDSKTAEKNVRENLNIESQEYNSPIARFIQPDSVSQNRPNIVVIIMEAMSVGKMGRHGNPKNLTPFLDSLSYNSIYFENAYTAGKHTFNGVFSTLFSFPALYQKHPMKQMRRYNGISHVLKQYDYSSIFFTTHDSQFDNVAGFLIDNEFDNIISQKDYPSEEIKTTLGVTDDYLFKYSIPIINEMHGTGRPFLSVFMTASDHGPYYIPEYFEPTAVDIKDQVVQYADWSLRQFVLDASKQTWFDNTIFVFIADHGSAIRTDYDISLDYHHTPLVFYAPKLLSENRTVSDIAGQIDVFPTILGLLNKPYLNNTLGIDLLSESRPYIIVNDDDKVGVLDTEVFLIMKQGERSKLYKYQQSDKTDYAKEYPEKVSEMESYVKSNLQVYQDMMTNNQTFIK